MKTLEELKRDLLERPPFNNKSYRAEGIREALDAAIAERDDLRSRVNAAAQRGFVEADGCRKIQEGKS